jgi:hypothetical protein
MVVYECGLSDVGFLPWQELFSLRSDIALQSYQIVQSDGTALYISN